MSEAEPSPPRHAGPAPQVVHRASLEECFACTDLKWRLGAVPETALVRGVFLSMLDRQATALGPEVEEEYTSYFRVQGFSAFRMYPVRDYLTRLVVLAQIRWGASEIPKGLRALQSAAFDTWRGTLVGRTALELFEPSLVGCLKFCERTYQSGVSGNYADFAVLEVRSDHITTRFRNEYVYIEHAMVGALELVARFCGERVAFETKLDDPFTGNVTIHRLGRLDG
jgi:uncharacterized protein (TIGR02265 family)